MARYTRPCRPMQLSYEVGGMACAFTLMTRGEAGEASSGSTNGNRELSARPYSRPTTVHPIEPTANPQPEIPESVPRTHSLQPHSQSGAREGTQASILPQPPHQSVPFESLFVPADDDQQWDEPRYGDEDEDTLGWDTHMDQVCQQLPPLFSRTVPLISSVGCAAGKHWRAYPRYHACCGEYETK